MTNRILVLLLTTAAALARAESADGGDELGTGELAGLLDTAVVSGPSRADERVDDSPATVTVVTAEQLRSLGLRTVHEAINFLSLGMLSQDPLHSVETGVRGVLLSGDYGNHLLVLVDGHTINESWNGTAYYEQGLGLPIELIDHLELIVGPGSVLYGSSAMLGVVNVVTRSASELGRLRVSLEGSLAPGQRADGSLSSAPGGLGGSGRAAVLSGFATQLAGAPFEVTAAAEYFLHQGQTLEFAKQTGLTESDGTNEWPQRWSREGVPGEWGGETRRYGTRSMSLWLKSRWGDLTAYVRGSSYSRTTPANDGFGVAVDFDGQAYERDRFLNAELRWSRVLNPHLSAMVRGYVDTYEYVGRDQSSSWLMNGSGDPPADVDLRDFTFLQLNAGWASWGGLEAQTTVDWLGDGRFPLMLGADARLRHFGAKNVDSALDGSTYAESNVYQATEWQLAAYAQQRARLLPSLLLNVGLRVDAQSVFAPNVAPRGALTWTTPWGGRLKAVVSTAFRSPSGYERFAEYVGFQIRNPNLSPEHVLTGELGYEQRFGRHRVQVVGFASRFTDLIRLESVTPTDELTMYQNSGRIMNGGGQALLEGAAGAFSYGLSFTGAVAVSDDQTLLPVSPSWFGNARVSWELSAGPRLSFLTHFSGPRLISAASNTGLDANGEPVRWREGAEWATAQCELRAVVEGSVQGVRGLRLRGVVGGNVMPSSGYVVGPRQSPSVDFTSPTLAPNNRLFALLTASWSLD